MKFIHSVGAIALLALTSVALAAGSDLDVADRRWIRQCVQGLASSSERVRTSAESAVGALGLDAIPEIVGRTTELDEPEHWEALGRSLAQMGQSDAAAALDACRDDWPNSATEELDALHGDLKSGRIAVSLPESTGPGEADPDVDRQVRELLSHWRGRNSFTPSDPRLDDIAALGRPAIPTLVDVLRDASTRSSFGGMESSAAASVLARLVKPGDEGVLGELILDGVTEAGVALGKLRTDDARNVLVAALNAGILDYQLREPIDVHAHDEIVQGALLDWLEKRGEFDEYGADLAAEVLGDHDVKEAVPALRSVVRSAPSNNVLGSVGKALAMLGARDGLQVLVFAMGRTEKRFGSDEYERHKAGEALNAVTDRNFYTGTFSPGSAKGNWDEAQERYRSWLKEHGDAITFDATRRKWVTPTD